MRLVRDILILVTTGALLSGTAWHYRLRRAHENNVASARESVERFAREISIQSTLGVVEQGQRGHPATIDPAWFAGDLPRNPLFKRTHPWLEIAPPSQKDLDHPRIRASSDREMATFWYNPSNGVLRARVPMGVSDAKALKLYNHINESSLPHLLSLELTPPPDR